MKIPNRLVAETIGMSESGVSLIRNGHRFPLMKTLEGIERAYGWKVEDQVKTRSTYAEAFNERLQSYYAEHGVLAN